MGILVLNSSRKWNKEFSLNGAHAELVYPPEIGGNEQRIVELTHVYVSPNQRSKGRATELILFILAYAKKQNLKLFIRICPYGQGDRLTKPQLKRFYKKFGFVQYNGHKDYFIL